MCLAAYSWLIDFCVLMRKVPRGEKPIIVSRTFAHTTTRLAAVVAFYFLFFFLMERNDDRRYTRTRGLTSRPLAWLEINGPPCPRDTAVTSRCTVYYRRICGICRQNLKRVNPSPGNDLSRSIRGLCNEICCSLRVTSYCGGGAADYCTQVTRV